MKGLPRDKRHLFMTVQEGGSTGEIYTVFHNTDRLASRHVESCRHASYRALGPIRIPVHSWTKTDGRAEALFSEAAAMSLAVAVASRVALGQWN
jgi:hypothetical protein